MLNITVNGWMRGQLASFLERRLSGVK